MKTFCILEQGKTVNDPITLEKKRIFNTSESDYYRLNWKTHDDPNAFISQTGIMWSEGRSLLYEKVPKDYKYYIFLDEDIVFQFENVSENLAFLLNKYKPFSATILDRGHWAYRDLKVGLGIAPKFLIGFLLHREAFPIRFFDLCLSIYSKEFADIIFPAPYHGSQGSMLYAQWICSKLYPGKQICFGQLEAKNMWHEPHEEGFPGIEHKKKIMDLFNKDTVDKTLRAEEWMPAALGRRNLSYSLSKRVSRKSLSPKFSDLRKVYNPDNPGFKTRTALRR